MQRESVTVLEECIDLQKRKSQDYQNPNSNIVQAMHYRRGLSSIHDMIHQKLLRAQSLLEPLENGEVRDPNFESLEDTYKDLINYASFAVSYIRGKMEGQQPDRDMLNRPQSTDIQSLLDIVDERVLLNESIVDDALQLKDNYLPNFTSKTTVRSVDVVVGAEYMASVAPLGPIELPEGEKLCSDSVQKTYLERILENKEVVGEDRPDSVQKTYRDCIAGETKVEDVGDRLDEDMQAAKEYKTNINNEIAQESPYKTRNSQDRELNGSFTKGYYD